MSKKLTQRAKRYVLTLVITMTAVFLTGCGGRVKSLAIGSGLLESPYYHLGDTEWDHGGVEEYYFNQLPSSLNEIYRELYSRLSAGEDAADLYAHVSVDDFWTAWYSVLADHPELFWVDSGAQVLSSAVTGKVVHYETDTTVPPEEREAMKAELEAAADACIAEIDPTFSDYGKIKAVYEYLIRTTDYDSNAPDSQCIQSALLSHASVCAGYSKAFQYILHRMGCFCTYATGTIEGGSSHAWNIVRIDGNYYHVDVTWGDPVFAGAQDGESGTDVISYTYLCCTDDVIYRTHTSDSAVALPACLDDSYNYYRLNGMYYDTFDWDTIYNALMAAVQNGNSISMEFGSREAYEEAKSALFDGGLLEAPGQYLMSARGVDRWSYTYRTDDDFYLIVIEWN